MKFKFSRAGGTGAQAPKTKRGSRSTAVPALQTQRETRFYSLLLPPGGNSTRRS